MRRSNGNWRVLSLLILALYASRSHAEPMQASISAALALPSRSAADRERDSLRKPAQVLAFSGLQRGMTVADLMAGDGWYTEIVARAIGPHGKVYAQNNSISADRYGDRLQERLEKAKLANVIPIKAELEELELPKGGLDLAMMVLFYHDTYWMKIDRAEMNRRIYQALEPGGVFLVIDHAAKPGAGSSQTKELHRIEEDLVQREIEAAGFVLDATSDLLRNAGDDHTLNVFDDRIRGRTDRFILRFRKPTSR